MSPQPHEARSVKCANPHSDFVPLAQVQHLVSLLQRQTRALGQGDHVVVTRLGSQAKVAAERVTGHVRKLDCEWQGTTDVMVANDLALWTCPLCGYDNETSL